MEGKYVIYKTTNLIDGKYYIGMDSNNNQYYLGSGILLKRAVKKYGAKNFKKEILFVCESFEELCEKEREIVNESLVNDEMCYNVSVGGLGGDKFTLNPRREEIRGVFKKNNAGEGNPMFGKPSANRGKKLSYETRKKISDGLKKSETFLAACRNPERIKKIKEKQKGKIVSEETRSKLRGVNNPMFGKHLTDDEKIKRGAAVRNSEKYKLGMARRKNKSKTVK